MSVFLAACGGGTTSPPDAAKDWDAPNIDAPPPGGDGSLMCTVTVHPCCGGPAPACIDQTDAGTCPAGTMYGNCYGPGGPTLGCYMQCIPDPPYCAPAGSTCADQCGGGCGIQTATDWYCVCA
jgi:hypothetical protein